MEKDKVLQKIEKAARDRESMLDLSGSKLTELPAELGQLKNLTTLSLSYNQLTELPAELGQLKNLTTLSLSYNQLTELPAELGQLTNLTTLSLSSNQLTELPPELGQLTNLTILSLSYNQLTELPPELGQLTNLTTLSLSSNQLTELPPELGQLTNLTILSLSHNQLTGVPAELGQLTNLTILSLSGNQLTELPPELGQLKNLTSLYLFDNQLTELPPELGQLKNLTSLYLQDNQLTAAPDELGQLKNLTTLDLSRNQLTALPSELGQLKNLTEFFLYGNSLELPPPEVVEKGTDAVLDFLRDLLVSGTERFIAKLLLVGEGGVGKTSILRNLLGEKYDQNLKTTHGIDVREYQLPHPDRNDVTITLNTWDFGGQQIYHATHQFFLTLRSVYIIVWSARSGVEQGRIEFWLDTIKSLAPDSPVILVATFIDERSPDVNYQALKSRFPQLCANLSISNKRDEDVDKLNKLKLVQTIARVSADLPHMGKPWPKNWIEVEDAIKNHEKHNIDLKEYLSLCQHHNVSEKVAEGILGDTLHFLGDILYYRDDHVLSDMVVLKPNWITKAISCVLTDKTVEEKYGILDHSDLPRIWNAYSKPLYAPFLRLMERFDLSYQIPFREGLSLIPQLLPHEPPSLEPSPADLAETELYLKMVYHLSFVPAGIMSWFIVRTHQYTANKHWRDGVFLCYKGHYALVELSKSARQISIQIWGPFPQNFFIILMNSMDEILKRFPGLDIEHRIPCICHRDENKKEPCKRFFLYEDLVRRFSAGKMYAECPDTLQDVSVQTMLYGIHPSTQQQIHQDLKELKAQVSEHTRDIKNQMDQMTELLNRNFSRTYNLIMEQNYWCPNVFLLRPKDRNRWDPRNLFSEPYVMQLYCQSPHAWHATPWEKEINKTKEWWLEFSSWLSILLEMIKFAVPVVQAIPHIEIPEDTFSEFEKDLDIMMQFANRLPKEGFSKDIDRMIKDMDSRPRMAVDSALRLLYSLLNKLDPVHEWGGLSHVLTPDGTLLWLCPEHKKEYESPILKI
jgi:internalin A